MKRIALIGSTGSIGRQVISVVKAHPDQFKIVAMAAGSSAKTFEEQINGIKPDFAALANKNFAKTVSNIPQQTRFSCGEEEALKVAAYPQADIVFVACGGFTGLKYSLAAIKSKKPLALANKETLVCGGDIVMPLAQKFGVPVIPVDSEHSAIWQCLDFNAKAPLKNLIITASGGAFRDYSLSELACVTPAQALCHPTWSMGNKITIDSATLLNKGYEVIEAHHLYGVDYKNIKTVIQRESIIHSMVEFCDGAIMAQMSNPSMILPIQLALTYPERVECEIPPMDFSAAFSLNFTPLVREKYPCYDLALSCGEKGGVLPCALNAAGEVAVDAFLKGKIGFLSIATVIDKVLQQTENAAVTGFEQLVEVDALSRKWAQNVIKNL